MAPVPPGEITLVCKIHMLLADVGFPNMDY